MNKRILAIAVVLLVAVVWAPLALALDTMGPPAAGLMQSQCSLGIDYSFSQMTFNFENEGGYKTKDNQLTKTFVNLGYGVMDNWEVYGRLGGSKWELNDWDELGANRLAWGLGTKATIAQDGNLKWGALFQISWNRSVAIEDGGDYVGTIKWYEYQIAAGPTYKLTDKVSIYGGPFYNYLKGDSEWTDEGSSDFKGSNHVGGYIGGQVAVNDNLSLNAEYQLSAGASGLGLQLVWKF